MGFEHLVEVGREVIHDQVQVLLLDVEGEELIDYADDAGVLELGDDVELSVAVLFLLEGDFESEDARFVLDLG